MGSILDSTRDRSREVREGVAEAKSIGEQIKDTAAREAAVLDSLPCGLDEELTDSFSLAKEALKADAHAATDAEAHSRVVEQSAEGSVINQQASEQIARGGGAIAGLQEAGGVGDYGSAQIADAVAAVEANIDQYQDVIAGNDAAIRAGYADIDRLQQEIDAL